MSNNTKSNKSCKWKKSEIVMYKIKINREKCKGCGICVEIHPHNWRILEDKNAHVVKFKIKKLGKNKLVEENCPYHAIKIEKI